MMVRCPHCGVPLNGDDFVVACDVAVCTDCIRIFIPELAETLSRLDARIDYRHKHIEHGITFFTPSFDNARTVTEVCIVTASQSRPSFSTRGVPSK